MASKDKFFRVRGSELKVGDTLATWWGNDTITAIKPHTGTLGHVFDEGASVADFARRQYGMTIDHAEMYEVIARMSV